MIWEQTREMKTLINKNQVMLKNQTLKLEVEPHQRERMFLYQQRSSVAVFHGEFQMPSEVAWTPEPSAEEMRWVQGWNKKAWALGREGGQMWEVQKPRQAEKTWPDQPQTLTKQRRQEVLRELLQALICSLLTSEVKRTLEVIQEGRRKRKKTQLCDALIQQRPSLA